MCAASSTSSGPQPRDHTSVPVEQPQILPELRLAGTHAPGEVVELCGIVIRSLAELPVDGPGLRGSERDERIRGVVPAELGMEFDDRDLLDDCLVDRPAAHPSAAAFTRTAARSTSPRDKDSGTGESKRLMVIRSSETATI